MTPKLISENTLFYGDNLPILREHIPDESVDLIYLDPPFNSNRSYNVLFRDESGHDSESQLVAFDDTWHWGDAAEQTYHDLVNDAPAHVGGMIGALRQVHRREPDDGLPGDDGRPPGGAAPRAEANREPVSALRSDGEPLSEDRVGCRLWA